MEVLVARFRAYKSENLSDGNEEELAQYIARRAGTRPTPLAQTQPTLPKTAPAGGKNAHSSKCLVPSAPTLTNGTTGSFVPLVSVITNRTTGSLVPLVSVLTNQTTGSLIPLVSVLTN